MSRPDPADIPAPPIGPESAPYFDAAQNDQLVIPVSKESGRAHFYPRPFCPFTGGEVEWRPASGRGVLYSFSVFRRAEKPWCVAYVELEEGPRMLTNIVDCDFDALTIGQTVRVVFLPTENGQKTPMFTPA